MVKALIRVSKTLAAVSAILVILAALLACGAQTPTPGGAVATVPAATEGSTSLPSPVTPAAEPTPPSSMALPTAAPQMGCGQLCSEEFWLGGANVASVLAELDDGADLTAKGHYGTPVLGYALTFGSNFEIVRLLLEAGADPNAQDDSGSTPLHIAVQIAAYASRPEAPARFSGNTDDSLENIYATIELLLQHGADAATRDNHGQSALFLYLANLIESESYKAPIRRLSNSCWNTAPRSRRKMTLTPWS